MGVHGQTIDSASKMKSSNNLRGQLGTRSGPLSPTASKLTTQYLVLDHMNNHYSKITKARPAIDNKPPKSMQTSQKARDRKLRDYVSKTGTRPAPTMSRPHTSYDQYDDIYDEKLWGDPSDDEEKMIHDIMRTTLRAQDQTMTQIDYDQRQRYPNPVQVPGQSAYTQQQRPSSARSQRSMGSAAMRSVVQVGSKKGTYDGDVIQKHAQVFTEEKPFTPRTLKTDRVSRLSQYKYYNKPPPKGPKAAPVAQPRMVESETKPKEAGVPPKPKPRTRKLSDTQEGNVTENSLMFETLHTRDYSKFDSNRDERVPKLDISLDADHLSWIKDQASKAQLRAKSGTLKSSIREDEAYDTTVDFGKTGEMSLTYGTLVSTKTRPVEPSGMRSSRISKEDEDAKYVLFMKDITSEVLDRGIYTDRALRQVFKTHIARKKGQLDELKMHQCCDQIRTELNIPRYDLKDDSSFTHEMNEPAVSHHGSDHHYHNKALHEPALHDRNHLDVNGRNSPLDTSLKSKASKASSGQLESHDTSHVESHDTYNFKSTGSEDMFSTIRSDANNATLSDTQALKQYQQTISLQDDLLIKEGSESEGEVYVPEPVRRQDKLEPIRQETAVAPPRQQPIVVKPVQPMIHPRSEPVVHGGDRTEPVVHGRDRTEPVVHGRDRTEPVVHGRDRNEPVIHGRDRTEPVVHGGDRTEPVVHGRDRTEPVVHGGDRTEPVVHGRDRTEPVVHGRDRTEPVVHGRDRTEPVVHGRDRAEPVVHGEERTDDKHRAQTPVSEQQSEVDDYEDDYDDDEYDDDGDDEDGGDNQGNTEPTATYRTDDDDF